MPALALTLHLFGKVDGFLAAAALVSSSERHSESVQESPVVYSFHPLCVYIYIYIMSLVVGSTFVLLCRRKPSPSYNNTCKRRSNSSLLYFLPVLFNFLRKVCPSRWCWAPDRSLTRLKWHHPDYMDTASVSVSHAILLSCAERSRSTKLTLNKQEILHIFSL